MDFTRKKNTDIWKRSTLVDKRDSELLAKEKKTSLSNYYNKLIKYQAKHYIKLKNFDKDLKLPKKNEIIKIRVQKRYNAFTFILAILEKYKTIDELIIVTFNINEKTLGAIFSFIDQGLIKKLKICVSESIKSRMPNRYEQIKHYYDQYKDKLDLEIVFTWNHCKIGLIKCGNNYYVIEGSGNYSENEEVEQYIFENSKESYDFDKYGLVEDLYKTVRNRNTRGEVLT